MALSRFQRMVALPEEEYQHLKALQQTNDPLQTKFHSLENDYRKQSFIPDAYARVQSQGETLNEMVKVKDELRKRLIQSTPKAFQSRSQSLFQFIENKLSINEKGEVLDDDGAIIHGSNIGDLVQHAVRDRRRNIVPAGWDHFLDILRETNAPRMIMNYDTLEELHTPGSRKPIPSPFKSSPKATVTKKSEPIPTIATVKRQVARQTQDIKRREPKRLKKQPAYLKDYTPKGPKRARYF